MLIFFPPPSIWCAHTPICFHQTEDLWKHAGRSLLSTWILRVRMYRLLCGLRCGCACRSLCCMRDNALFGCLPYWCACGLCGGSSARRRVAGSPLGSTTPRYGAGAGVAAAVGGGSGASGGSTGFGGGGGGGGEAFANSLGVGGRQQNVAAGAAGGGGGEGELERELLHLCAEVRRDGHPNYVLAML